MLKYKYEFFKIKLHTLLINSILLICILFVYIAINNSDEVIGDNDTDNLTTESNQRWVFLPIELWVEYLLAALN